MERVDGIEATRQFPAHSLAQGIDPGSSRGPSLSSCSPLNSIAHLVNLDQGDAGGVVGAADGDGVEGGLEGDEEHGVLAAGRELEGAHGVGGADDRGRIARGAPVIILEDDVPLGIVERDDRISQRAGDAIVGQGRTDAAEEHLLRLVTGNHKAGDHDVVAGADDAARRYIHQSRRGAVEGDGVVVDLHEADAGVDGPVAGEGRRVAAGGQRRVDDRIERAASQRKGPHPVRVGDDGAGRAGGGPVVVLRHQAAVAL